MLFFFYEAMPLFLWSNDPLYSLVTTYSRTCINEPLNCKDISIWAYFLWQFRVTYQSRFYCISAVFLPGFLEEVIGPEPDICEELFKALYHSVRMFALNESESYSEGDVQFAILQYQVPTCLPTGRQWSPESLRVLHLHYCMTVYNKLWYLPSHIVTSESWCL